MNEYSPCHPWDRTNEQRIEDAFIKKELAKEHFQNQEYQLAGEEYINALKDIIPITPPLTVECDKNINLLRTACYANLSACQLKLKQYDRTIKNCTKCLELDENNVKSLFRRATSLFYCADYGKSKEDIDYLLTLEPNNNSALDLLTKLKLKLFEKDKRDAEIMKAFMKIS